MIIKEFRVVLPITVEEYQVGQLYSVAEASKNETGGGEGIEVLKNEPFDNVPLLGGKFTKGQYTYKIYHLASKVPAFIRLLAPKGSLEIHEEAWNAYPYCKTVITNPDYMKNNFFISIETMHCPDAGDQHNVHELPPEKLKQRDVVFIDIANDTVESRDYKETEDPTKFKSEKTGRGPLVGNWQKNCTPIMCAYKLVTVEFKCNATKVMFEELKKFDLCRIRSLPTFPCILEKQHSLPNSIASIGRKYSYMFMRVNMVPGFTVVQGILRLKSNFGFRN
ncbi:Phosphatidylinositol transfer protein alpha like protein [Argiope bruennichi]|uniref:Phosphatidylinositol transfer protein alpha like protein n=1 Tax=Argiope bruennichi TaxID=94029 RepID=A0A8T0FQD7_ARGBR|nr:Phosphatidylinositol transfer protein alpha like protein [Argiope bruennichi]